MGEYRDMFRVSSYAWQAGDVIKHLILNGTYQPGQQLKEVELSKSLGISRSPVREAIQSLAREGLVDIVPHKGAFVETFDPSEIRELFETREALETMACRLAAERAKPAQLDELEKLLEDTANFLEREQAFSYPRDLDFHLQICKASHNRKLEDRAFEIETQLQLARSRSASEPGRASIAYREHEAILIALKQRDPEASEQKMREHIRNAMDNMLKLLDTDQGAGGAA